MFFVALEPVDIETFLTSPDPTNFHFYCSNSSIRHSALFQGRPILLSESSLQTLEQIASHGRNGVTQAELSKLLGCDSKNVFHWLKSLIANDLIARTPVASKKTFTYLLTLTKFVDEDISAASTEITQSHTIVSSKEIRQRIVDILAKAPNQTMVSKDVFAQTGLDYQLIKNFRRAATKLNQIGWLEYLFEDQLIGPCCRLFRLKRKPAEGLDLKIFLDVHEGTKKLEIEPQEIVPLGSDFKPDQPIIHQIILLLSNSFPDQMTTTELSHRLNISRKYLYKLIERMVPITNNKLAVIGAEGVGKVSDFVGKEKRLKLFIKSEEYRDHYVKMFSNENSKSNLSVKSSNLSTPIPSRPTTPISSSISQISTPPRSDTRTRQLRHQVLLQELSEKRILEVGKDLCVRIQSLLGDNRFALDIKTLRRSVQILEREGSLKVVVATIPSGIRTLIISLDLTASDPLVQNYIKKLNEFVRTGPLSASTQKLMKLKEAMQQADFFVEGSLPFGLPQNPSVNAKALTHFGFIYGVLARAQLFHQYLLNQATDGCFETIPTVFEKISLNLYLKIIGIVRLSKSLSENLGNFLSISVSDLPEVFKDELGLNRKRFHSNIAMLLQTLEQLKLIQGENQYASLNFKLPYKYQFAHEVPIYNYNGEIKKIIKSTDETFFEEFWNSMRQISVDYQNRNVSIHDDESGNDLKIPKPILLARFSASWKLKPSREKDLNQSLRKLLADSKNHFNFDYLASLQEISEEFEVPLERVKIIFENLQLVAKERIEAKRLYKLNRKRRTSIESDESEVEEIELEHLRWTLADWQKLSVAFAILQQPLFLSGGTGIKWNLTAQIFDKSKSPIVIRRHGLKLFKSYRELRNLLEIDTIVQLVMRTLPTKEITDLYEIFEKIYNSVQEEISNLDNSNIFDQFITGDTEKSIDLLEPRQDHYLNTIDSWVLTRSFRHGLLLNNSGLIRESEKPNIVLPEITLLLRQILVYSYLDSFDYDKTVEILKSIPSDSLSNSIEHLISTNFAARNKSRDKYRLFGYPLVISESIRSVIEYSESFDESNILITNQTETLSMNKIENVINEAIEGNLQIAIKPSGEDFKFDAPIEITRRNFPSPDLDLTCLSGNHLTIWQIPKSSTLIPNIANNCLSHVKKTIKSFPGISIEILKLRYENVLEGFEIDLLIDCLLKNEKISITLSKYLQ